MDVIVLYNKISQKGGYPDLNREYIVPHTTVLPIELYPPLQNNKYKTHIIVLLCWSDSNTQC